MQVIEADEGAKAPYALSGTVLTVGDVAVDLQEAERDVEVRIILYATRDGRITTVAARRYAALICIPPRRYEPGEAIDAGMPGPDPGPDPGVVPVPLPVDPALVTLTLWALPDPAPQEA